MGASGRRTNLPRGTRQVELLLGRHDFVEFEYVSDVLTQNIRVESRSTSDIGDVARVRAWKDGMRHRFAAMRRIGIIICGGGIHRMTHHRGNLDL